MYVCMYYIHTTSRGFRNPRTRHPVDGDTINIVDFYEVAHGKVIWTHIDWYHMHDDVFSTRSCVVEKPVLRLDNQPRILVRHAVYNKKKAVLRMDNQFCITVAMQSTDRDSQTSWLYICHMTHSCLCMCDSFMTSFVWHDSFVTTKFAIQNDYRADNRADSRALKNKSCHIYFVPVSRLHLFITSYVSRDSFVTSCTWLIHVFIHVTWLIHHC